MKTKSKLFTLLLAIVLAVSIFSACNGTVTYSLSADKTEYTVFKGDSFALPSITVKNNKDAVVTDLQVEYSIKDPDNTTVTPVSSAFIAQKTGKYVITVTIKDKPDVTPLIINVTVSSQKCVTPANFSLTMAGVVSFDSDPQYDYILVINGTDKGAVATGDNIFSLIPAGSNTITVRATKSEYIDSDAATAVSITKATVPANVSVSAGKIYFTPKTGEVYNLYNEGVLVAEDIKNEDDISAFLEEDYNEISVAVTATATIMASDLSDSIDFALHLKITDFAIDNLGNATFYSLTGYTYDLYIKPAGQNEIKAVTGITSGASVADVLDTNLLAGANEVYIKVNSSNTDMYKILDGANVSNVVSMTKLGTVQNFALNGNTVVFDAITGATYELYIDKTYKAGIASGDDFTKYITKKDGTTVSVAIKAVRAEAGYWSGALCVAENYSFVGYVEDLFNTSAGTIVGGKAFKINEKVKGSGLNFEGTAGNKIIYNGTINLLGYDAATPIITLHPTAVNGLYDMTRLTIRLIDKVNSANVITFSVYRNGGDIKLGISYKLESASAIDANWAGYSVFDKIAGSAYDVTTLLSIYFNPATKTISDGYAGRSLALASFEGFEAGTTLEVEIEGATGASAVTITAINGIDATRTIYFDSTKNLFNTSAGTIVGGKAFKINEKVKGSGLNFEGTVGNKITYNGTINLLGYDAATPIITLHPTAVNGLYDMTRLTIRLIDKVNSANVITFSVYRNGGDIKLDISYKLESAPAIDANWAGYSVFDKIAGSAHDVTTLLSIYFNPATKTISDGYAGRGLALTSFEGFEAGATLEVDITETYGVDKACAVTITAINGIDTTKETYDYN